MDHREWCESVVFAVFRDVSDSGACLVWTGGSGRGPRGPRGLSGVRARKAHSPPLYFAEELIIPSPIKTMPRQGFNKQGRRTAEYFSCVATVMYIRKENCMYQACPGPDCSKKVVQQHSGLYRCDKCNREFPNCKPRFLLSANIADFGENHWDENAFDEVFQRVNFTTHIFKTRVKLETYNDESRVKAIVMEIQPVDHRDYSRRLIANIRKMAAC
ncbi:hypothetical protein NHX12_010416 [Muraenolepis orangiensis]|uniref:Replication factor A C-terminal domain-containing protein n=1 Tax=Muraenolepis orangiensis TaxID=630683 RepID=A0A9Q0IAE9_9TELE|nr:hypothetical protein NHX12_010416 [Muraenolepis orangiensis]